MARFGFTQIHRWGEELYVDSTDASVIDRAAGAAKVFQPGSETEVKSQSCIVRKVKMVLAFQLRLISELGDDGWEMFQVDQSHGRQDWFTYHLRKSYSDS